MDKDEFYKKMKEAEKKYYRDNPCRHCSGNGCDDCRDCKYSEIVYNMREEIDDLKKEYKDRFGIDYDKESEIKK